MLSLVGFVAFVIVVSAIGAAWRTRPQFADPRTEMRWAFFVLLLAAAGLASSGPQLGPVILASAPPAVVAGWLMGTALSGRLRFWTDTETGRLKFRGGAAYFVILAVSACGRVFLRFLVTGSIAGQGDPSGLVPQAAMVLTGSLLFVDTGLYLARARAIASATSGSPTWHWRQRIGGAR